MAPARKLLSRLLLVRSNDHYVKAKTFPPTPTVPPAMTQPTREPSEASPVQPVAAADTDAIENPVRNAVQLLGSVIAPSAVVTGLLYYFGYAYNEALYGYFGIDQTTLGLSTQTYLLKSSYPMLWPLIAILLICLVWASIHSLALHAMQSRKDGTIVRTLSGASFLVGLAILLMGLISALTPNPSPTLFAALLPPVGLALGIALASYGVHLLKKAGRPTAGTSQQPKWLGSVIPILVGLLIVTNLFWAVGKYAAAVGGGNGRQIAVDLPRRTSVIIYSVHRLFFDSPSIHEIVLHGTDGAYKFKYTGFRFLTHSDDRYFLLPDGWSTADPTAIVIRDDDNIGVQFIRAI
jgi:hypothetical protein